MTESKAKTYSLSPSDQENYLNAMVRSLFPPTHSHNSSFSVRRWLADVPVEKRPESIETLKESVYFFLHHGGTLDPASIQEAVEYNFINEATRETLLNACNSADQNTPSPIPIERVLWSIQK